MEQFGGYMFDIPEFNCTLKLHKLVQGLSMGGTHTTGGSLKGPKGYAGAGRVGVQLPRAAASQEQGWAGARAGLHRC